VNGQTVQNCQVVAKVLQELRAAENEAFVASFDKLQLGITVTAQNKQFQLGITITAQYKQFQRGGDDYK